MKLVLLLSLLTSFSLLANTEYCASSDDTTICVIETQEGFLIKEETYQLLTDVDIYLDTTFIISSQEYASIIIDRVVQLVVPQSDDKDVRDPRRCAGAIIGSAISSGATAGAAAGIVAGPQAGIAVGVAVGMGTAIHTASTSAPCQPKPRPGRGDSRPQLGNH